jgi:hypothetical protein
MGATHTKTTLEVDEREVIGRALEQGFLPQSTVADREKTAADVRGNLPRVWRQVHESFAADAGPSTTLTLLYENIGQGVASKARYICDLNAAGYACSHVMVSKCAKTGGAAFNYDAAIAALVSKLVVAKISPHFTMLYHANTSQGEERCMLLEANERTFDKFLTMNFNVLRDGPEKAKLERSFKFQIAHALLAAFVTFGVSHNDLHAQNVMGVAVRPGTTYRYKVFEREFTVDLQGWLWKLIDFDNADIGGTHTGADGVQYETDDAVLKKCAGPIRDFLYLFRSGDGAPDPALRSLAVEMVEEYGFGPLAHMRFLEAVLSQNCDDAERADARHITDDFDLSRAVDTSDVHDGFGATLQFRRVSSYFVVSPALKPAEIPVLIARGTAPPASLPDGTADAHHPYGGPRRPRRQAHRHAPIPVPVTKS